MSYISYREATNADIPSLVRLRNATSETEQYWYDRILGYLDGTHHPEQALRPRIVYVALAGNTVVGFIARSFDQEVWMRWRIAVDRRSCGTSAPGYCF